MDKSLPQVFPGWASSTRETCAIPVRPIDTTSEVKAVEVGDAVREKSEEDGWVLNLQDKSVRLKDLKVNTGLNGQVGVVDRQLDDGKWRILLTSGKFVQASPDNFEVVEDDADLGVMLILG